VLSDHLNTARVLSNRSGDVEWRSSFEAFGLLTVDSSSSRTVTMRFPGQYAEDPLSIFSNFHRYYEPATGRYLSTDPIGQLGGINLYAYVLNNPLLVVRSSRTQTEGVWPSRPNQGLTLYRLD